MRIVDPRSVRSLLVVGAHAFDAEVLAGPFAAAVVAGGGTANFVHLSWGEQGHTELSPEKYAEQKRSEAHASSRALGCEQIGFDLPDAFITPTDDIALRLTDVVRRLRPQVVVTHWSGSWHKDHRAAHRITADALFYAALPTLIRTDDAASPEMLLFGENWEDLSGFDATVTVDVSAGFEAWQSAIGEYELARGLSSFPYRDYYSSLYRMRGCVAGVMHAQAFATAPASALAGVQQFLIDDQSLRDDPA